MILTGNVQVKRDHLGLGRDLVVSQDIESPSELQPFIALAQVIHGKMSSVNTEGDSMERGNVPLAIMQLSHAGRQSTTFLGGRSLLEPPLAPSAIPVELKSSQSQTIFSKFVSRVLFQTPRAMTTKDIDDVIEAFKRGAMLARKSGFDGIEIHAAHGCKYEYLFYVIYARDITGIVQLTRRPVIDLVAGFISPQVRFMNQRFVPPQSLTMTPIHSRTSAQTPTQPLRTLFIFCERLSQGYVE